MDTVKKEIRSRIMAAVRSKNTRAEVEFRKRIHALGYRFRIHGKNLPGSPDIVFPKYHAVVFIHGCFWHLHSCRSGRLPETRRNWWKAKLEANRKRDKQALANLQNMSWRTLVVWECSFRKPGVRAELAFNIVTKQIEKFLITKKPFQELPTKSNVIATSRKR